MLKRASEALAFAEALRAKCETDWAAKIQAAAVKGEEHKILRKEVEALLAASGHNEFRFDFEGDPDKRDGGQQHSYPVLGTWTHPDAAVLKPFTCAIEFDRERLGKESHFKASLMKAACHVLSCAYDASLLVFSLQRPASSRKTYLEDSHHTLELVASLRSRGMVVAFVPATGTAASPSPSASTKTPLDSFYEYEDGSRVELGESWCVRPDGKFRFIAQYVEEDVEYEMKLEGPDEKDLTGSIRPKQLPPLGDWKHETPLTMTLVSFGSGQWTWEGTVQGEPDGSNDYFLRLVANRAGRP